MKELTLNTKYIIKVPRQPNMIEGSSEEVGTYVGTRSPRIWCFELSDNRIVTIPNKAFVIKEAWEKNIQATSHACLKLLRMALSLKQ